MGLILSLVTDLFLQRPYNPVALLTKRTDPDGIGLRWQHGVNSQQQWHELMVSAALNLTLAEIDIRDQDGVAVLSHDPAQTHDMTFQQLLSALRRPDCPALGIKLDFKSVRAVELCVSDLVVFCEEIHPVVWWLNADVLPLTDTQPPVPLEPFLRLTACTERVAALSLGWHVDAQLLHAVASGQRSVSDVGELVSSAIVNMQRVCERPILARRHVTYPVRAGLLCLPEMLPGLVHLVLADVHYRSLTLWHSDNDPVDHNYLFGVQSLRDQLPRHSILYDLPPNVLNKIR